MSSRAAETFWFKLHFLPRQSSYATLLFFFFFSVLSHPYLHTSLDSSDIAFPGMRFFSSICVFFSQRHVLLSSCTTLGHCHVFASKSNKEMTNYWPSFLKEHLTNFSNLVSQFCWSLTELDLLSKFLSWFYIFKFSFGK